MDNENIEALRDIDNLDYLEVMADSVNNVVDVCHSTAVESGWWNDPITGAELDRNEGELICLMHSELSEAMEGLRKNKMDDHLPHRPNAEVELADCMIRIMDFAGAKGYDIGGAIVEKLQYNVNRADHKPENRVKEGGKKF